jgi:UDP-2,3-diacylglucosamine pyrophosphatase LpxH
MSSKLIVSISDLHLGRGNNQDSFCGPRRRQEIKAFAAALGKASRQGHTDVTLVLNGDIFDMWELVSDQELEDTPAALRAIRRGLLVPAKGPAALDAVAAQAASRLREALDVHPEFVSMLKVIADAGGTIHYNAGNHDHRFSHPRLRAVLQKALKTRGIDLPPERFDVYFHDDQLGFYAEHGDQFSDEDSRSPHSTDAQFLDEARGFYFLRYVWNRVESREHSFAPRGDLLSVLDIVRKVIDGGPSHRFLSYLYDYFRVVRDDGVPLVTDELVVRAYVKWLGSGAVEKGAADTKSRPWRDSEPARPIVRPDAPGWLPGIEYEFSPTGSSRYIDGLCHRFYTASPLFPRLRPGIDRVLTLGHTHEATKASLTFSGTVHAEYLNSGSWTQQDPMRYVWVYKEDLGDNKPPVCGVRSLAGGLVG